MSIFSDRINGIMSKRHISQKQLANWANVTESAMSYYVNGARTPRIQVISRLAGLLGVTTDYLLGADVPEKENESQFQYIQRNLAKLNPEQLSKAAKILELVFDDVFTSKEGVTNSSEASASNECNSLTTKYCINTDAGENNTIDAQSAFNKVLITMKENEMIPDMALNTWISALIPVLYSDKLVVFSVETEFQRNIIMDSYIHILSSGYQKVFGVSPEIEINVK
jgi:transcriptional regulator with XRE-family HTH domain